MFRIRRDTFDHLGHRLTKEIVHGMTNLTAEKAGPHVLAGLLRSHWRIENTSHWVRDVVYREDDQHAYAGTGAQVIATLRTLALGCSAWQASPRSPAHCNGSPLIEPGYGPSARPLPAPTDLEIPLADPPTPGNPWDSAATNELQETLDG